MTKLHLEGNMSISINIRDPAKRKAPPVFQGIQGYTPLPLDTPYKSMTHQQVVDEIRHYITIAQQKAAWVKQKNQAPVLQRKPKSAP